MKSFETILRLRLIDGSSPTRFAMHILHSSVLSRSKINHGPSSKLIELGAHASNRLSISVIGLVMSSIAGEKKFVGYFYDKSFIGFSRAVYPLSKRLLPSLYWSFISFAFATPFSVERANP